MGAQLNKKIWPREAASSDDEARSHRDRNSELDRRSQPVQAHGPVARVLLECLGARTTATKARWIVQLACFSWPYGTIPMDEDLEPFLRGPFLEAAREVLDEWTANDLLQELEAIFALPPAPRVPIRSTFRPTGRKNGGRREIPARPDTLSGGGPVLPGDPGQSATVTSKSGAVRQAQQKARHQRTEPYFEGPSGGSKQEPRYVEITPEDEGK